jgi:hypothetical protein
MNLSPLCANPSGSIRDTFESDENEIDSRDLKLAKHLSQITSTDAGKRIDVRPVSRNATCPIRDNPDLDSIEIDVNDPHAENDF